MKTHMEELTEVGTALRDYIDAIPKGVQLPAMPGIDRDYVDSVLDSNTPQEHKENCIWNEFYRRVYAQNPNGPDEQMEVDEHYLSYTDNVHQSDKAENSAHISFNFCPCCGIAL